VARSSSFSRQRGRGLCSVWAALGVAALLLGCGDTGKTVAKGPREPELELSAIYDVQDLLARRVPWRGKFGGPDPEDPDDTVLVGGRFPNLEACMQDLRRWLNLHSGGPEVWLLEAEGDSRVRLRSVDRVHCKLQRHLRALRGNDPSIPLPDPARGCARSAR
jgi:hypothetical protein